MKTIIFDFYRTLFNPKLGLIEKETINLLQYLKSKKVKLGLISTGDSKRFKEIASLGLDFIFDYIKITKNKSVSDFEEVLKLLDAKKETTFVIGDRLEEEIAIANSLKLKSVWLNLESQNRDIIGKTPWKTIKNITEFKEIFIREENLLNQKNLTKLRKEVK